MCAHVVGASMCSCSGYVYEYMLWMCIDTSTSHIDEDVRTCLGGVNVVTCVYMHVRSPSVNACSTGTPIHMYVRYIRTICMYIVSCSAYYDTVHMYTLYTMYTYTYILYMYLYPG